MITKYILYENNNTKPNFSRKSSVIDGEVLYYTINNLSHVNKDKIGKIGYYVNVKGTDEIGIIRDMGINNDGEYIYLIKYDRGVSHYNLNPTQYVAFRHEIHYAKTKDEVEMLIQSDKYNL